MPTDIEVQPVTRVNVLDWSSWVPVVYIAHIAANHAMRGPHAGRRKWSDFYEGIPTDSTRSSAYVRVRTWTPRIFHAAEYVRTRTYACGLHTFSTRPDTYVRVRTHVDSTHSHFSHFASHFSHFASHFSHYGPIRPDGPIELPVVVYASI
jgi:hypothetical protein